MENLECTVLSVHSCFMERTFEKARIIFHILSINIFRYFSIFASIE